MHLTQLLGLKLYQKNSNHLLYNLLTALCDKHFSSSKKTVSYFIKLKTSGVQDIKACWLLLPFKHGLDLLMIWRKHTQSPTLTIWRLIPFLETKQIVTAGFPPMPGKGIHINTDQMLKSAMDLRWQTHSPLTWDESPQFEFCPYPTVVISLNRPLFWPHCLCPLFAIFCVSIFSTMLAAIVSLPMPSDFTKAGPHT